MIDVILIYPRRTLWDINKITTRLPLAALYTGSVLRENGFSVKVIDQRVDEDWQDTLRHILEEGRPLWVGISSMTGMQIKWGLEAAQIIRQNDPAIPLVWGGVHPTILPTQTLSHPLVDLVVVGEGEMTALELSRTLQKGGQGMDLGKIAGLVWTNNGKSVHNPPRTFTPMDELPQLDYSLVSMENYILSEVPGERSLQITTSRGCPMNCGYCYLTVVPDGRRYRAESPEHTLEHIERLVATYDINAIHIIDDEFFTQRKRARRVCEMLLERRMRLTLRSNCRIDYIDQMDHEDLELFHQAGFKHIYLGAESGNNRVLDLIGKGITKEQILSANLKLKKAGIAPKFSFMGGFPGETVDEVKDTKRLMVQLVKENAAAYTTPLQLYSPYPGTPLFEQCRQTGMKVPIALDEWANSSWEQINTRMFTAKEQHFLNKAAYFTFFLDGKTVAELMKSPLMRLAARVYGWIVRKRIGADFYALMPEVA